MSHPMFARPNGGAEITRASLDGRDVQKETREAHDLLQRVRHDLDKLIEIGPDYAVWGSAQATHKYLKQARKALSGIG